MSDLDKALRKFEAVEANLSKLEKCWNTLEKQIARGIIFEINPVYEDACRSYKNLLGGLPLINGWQPTTLPLELDDIAQSHSHALKVGEVSIEIEVSSRVEKLGKELRKYRFLFDQKRRQLVQNIIIQTFNEIDHLLDQLQVIFPIDEASLECRRKIDHPSWRKIREKVRQIDVLLGSSISRPPRWSDMERHLYYAESHDLRDIVYTDWPSVKAGLTQSLYASNEPIPLQVEEDLDDLVASKPSGSVLTKLKWEKLSPEDFERLVFNLVSSEQIYENPQWLMCTNAPDRGRDLSVYKVYQDRLSGISRKRVIIQCKHWLSRSVSKNDFSMLKEEVKLWEPPRIDILVIATTGRFTADAISLIEKHNQSDSAMVIEMWAESNLERVLASNPAVVAEFGLR
ncbi:restriction endonuclease [Cyanobacterium sp. IPPAS B-1200]|uniref:restriction endonuclease n=1 Tax=Cyanobacterium sp. IPPAS B-1200 TaxID=1562720 RepID=UPI000852718B|nr:restriction endonuclease [Cyanobacterium sp. IPPAS B-1200]OEJ80105.1 restriction endonuclease [Cyanobacterium sp. IPPAS B-1200]